MDRRAHLLFGIIFATFYLGKGCQIDGVTNWFIPISESVVDTFRGTVYNRSTSSIEAINSISFFEGLNNGPYLDITFADSRLNIVTNDAFAEYEENETAESFSFTIVFRCTGGTTSTLVFLMNVIDTNNNAPQFMPSSNYEFTIAPPIPPGFLVTGCLNDITVRDIDLTTQRIDYEIEDNQYFEIEYDATSTEPKEFKATLKSTTFIRSIPEPITLRITATDVDLTGDPRLSTSATIRIIGDSEFEFPEEPVFSQPFYLANYTEDHRLIVHDTITLLQGYDDQVSFTLEGEYSSNFLLVANANQISIVVDTPLPEEVLMDKQMFIVVKAAREYTTGDTATVIVQLPEEASLEFERAHYEGSIENNVLQLSHLTLSQGYNSSSVSIVVISEFSSYFSVDVQGSQITLTMSPLSDIIIEENNFIYLQISAFTIRSSASAIITLEIIKNDKVTPVFNKPIFTGAYDSTTGLSIEQITIIQGYDETVSVNLEGEHASYFQIDQSGSAITLTSSTIPPEIFSEQHILLSVEATKPRTVGANAAVVIALPAARELRFEAPTYRGSLRDNELILETIELSVGYEENVNFVLDGDLANYFTTVQNQNQVDIRLTTVLPADFINANNNVILILTASGLNAVSYSATIVLEIVKDDIATPIFNQMIYYGTYSGASNIEIGNINLIQGYDDTVTFRIEGEHAQYFGISNTDNSVIVYLRSAIPEEIIFNEKVLSFIIQAEKDLTVGANAAILIRFPTEFTESTVMRFGQKNYIGTIQDNNFSLENIILDTGFTAGTEFTLTGDYSSYFSVTNTTDTVSIFLLNPLPDDIVKNNSFIVMNLEAQRERAISTFTCIIIDVIKEDIIPPVFSKPFYSGVYTEEIGLQFDDDIFLALGYDETVTFTLEGEGSALFSVVHTENVVTLIVLNLIPETILQNNNQFLFSIVANKPNAVSGRSAIFIDLPKDVPDQIILRFEQSSYVGTIYNGELEIPNIILSGNHSEAIHVNMIGEYISYFTLSMVNNIIVIEANEIPIQVINENIFIILELEAIYPEAVTGYTTLVIEIVKDAEPQILTPIFERAYYTGEYSNDNGLIFTDTMKLIQGFNESVIFSLSGDDSQWFILEQNVENSLTLAVKPDSAPQSTDRSKFVFAILAEKPGSLPGHAAVVISITDISTVAPLRFSRDFYTGSIENGNLTLEAIRLEEGYSTNAIYSLLGDYSNYFQLTEQDGIFTLQLIRELPTEVEANNILVFTLEVQAENTRAHTTIVLELLTSIDSEVALAFEETYYVGSYSENSGLHFYEQVRLKEETNETVQFSLSGGDSQWFGLNVTGNSIQLTLPNPIPAAVLANNPHLIFVISAQRIGSTTASATIIISLKDEYTDNNVLGFDRITYVGSIENNIADIPPITLNEGFTEDVTFTLHGEMANYFQLKSEGPSITIDLETAIPEEAIPANSFTWLQILASAPPAIMAHATILVEFRRQNASTAVELKFNEAFYTGTYSEEYGLTIANPIYLSAGYDDNVSFMLSEGDSQWFGLNVTGNSIQLTLPNPIPAAVLANNPHLIFVISAQRTGSTTASATIIISLKDEYTDNNVLGFDRITYVGSIENNIADIPPITLNEGFTEDVIFTLHGEMANYFQLKSEGPSVTIDLETAIPEEAIPANSFTWLQILASAPPAIMAHATILVEFRRQNASTAVELKFNEAFYTGTYSEEYGLTIANPIYLSAGYDDNVSFMLSEGDSQWFGLNVTGNSIQLTLPNPIPAAVLANNPHLIFVISAQRTGSTTASATIIISLKDEYTDNNVLGFDRITYVGSIENNIADIPPITLNEGFTEDVTFTLHGEMANYFQLKSEGPSITIDLETAIPEEAIPANSFTWLQILASAPPAIMAHATILVEFRRQNASTAVELKFNEAFYTGTYSEEYGLTIANPIYLSAGYDDNVSFMLSEGDSQWFGLNVTGNSIQLTLPNPIPAAVLANNPHLIFVISAQRTGSTTASSTIIISLKDEYTDNNVLGFDRITYVGSIENNIADIPPITLNEGFTEDVTFTLHGEMANYFQLKSEGPSITIDLETAIPEEAIPANNFTWLQILASAPPAIMAHATILVEFRRQNASTAVELKFNEAFYTGTYSEEYGLTIANPIYLSAGYDDNVSFMLSEGDSQWFGLNVTGNSIQLTLPNPIPAAVLANNPHLIFVISAQRTGSTTASSTIIISLKDEYTDNNVLGFDRITYVGSIENNIADIPPITLNEGFTEDVIFTLHGEMANYFQLKSEGPSITIDLETAIPEEAIPANNFTWLQILASAPPAIMAHATILVEFRRQNASTAVELKFNEAFYTGTYSEEYGLTIANPIYLSAGYDDNVSFMLSEGDSQWFGLNVTGNSIQLTLPNPIPAAVLANNPHLIFVISAQRTGSTTASSTIIISLKDEYTDNNVLGFDRITYVGSIENNIADIPPITLNEGFTEDVIFTLHGEMANYFQLKSEGPSITIDLETAIPEEAIPANSFTWLQILASAPPAIMAHATILVEFRRQNASTAVELKFNEAFYTGTYSEEYGLTIANPIYLSAGYDDNVSFMLSEGDSQWFGLNVTGNSIQLTLPNPIPAAVLANNPHLIFVISAQRTGSTTASATIIISLKDEYTDNNVLGFDRITYVGSIENNIADIPPITLNEGFTEDVTFTLHGEMANYFQLKSEGPSITIDLETAIPEEAIPANSFTWLQILASAPPAIMAHATILVEFRRQNASTAVELKFNEAFYTGTYSEEYGLTIANPIYLSAGYDDNVSFMLSEGDSQWFGLNVTGNSIQLTLPNPIPAAVLANNPHLIFVISAQRTGSTTASSTIIISLKDEYTDNNVLGFDRITYVGSIENNIADIPPITLNEGYTEDVIFTLHGEMANYFQLKSEGPSITIDLETAIPEEAIPANSFTWLQILASAPPAIMAHATILVEFRRQNASTAVELKFNEAFYTGTYSEEYGLTIANPIYLSAGYDDNVSFMFSEGDSQWFRLNVTGNSIQLTLPNPIPAAVLANNPHLIFVISAQRTGSTTASATIIISLKDEYTDNNVLGFDRITYVGSIENNIADIPPITLNEGFTEDVTFTLHGEMANYFQLKSEGPSITIDLETAIPEEAIPANSFTWLQILASAPPAIMAHATILVEFRRQNASTAVELKFNEAFYTGTYSEEYGLTIANPIYLSAGYDDNVSFMLSEGDSQWFGLNVTGNSIQLTLPNPIPAAVLANNPHLIFVISAQRAGSTTASATIIISLKDEYTDNNVLGFDRITYVGSIENNIADIPPITLNEGFTEDVTFTLHGEMANYFQLKSEGPSVTIDLETAIPEEAIPANSFTWLQILASAPPAIMAHATILVEFRRQNASTAVELKFNEAFYTGTYSEEYGLTIANPIYLSAGYDDNVSFMLSEGDSQWFGLNVTGNSIQLTLPNPIPAAVLANNPHLIFVISAQRAGSTTARATIIISLKDEYTDNNVLGFDRITYVGSIENNIADIPPITLNEGFTEDVIFTLHGEMANYFQLKSEGPSVTIDLETAIPEEAIPANSFTWLQILASAPPAIMAHATILVEFRRQNASTAVELKFNEAFYTGTYSEEYGLTFANPIYLSAGYDENVSFTLDGEHSRWFSIVVHDNSVLLAVAIPIPNYVLSSNNYLIFVISAHRPGSSIARATVIISIDGAESQNNVTFGKVLYEGLIQLGVVQHESITISGYTGTSVLLLGEYASAFESHVSNGIVTIQGSGTVTLPATVTLVVLELHADGASAVLLLNILESETPVLPSVSFGSPTYALRVGDDQTGVIARVEATADNGESLTYSLVLDNVHLQARISINNEGEIHLSSPADIGEYTIQVVATTIITQVSGFASVYLSIETITTCGDNDINIPPLIILNRDEEESHNNLVVLNGTQYDGCQYTLLNRWPADQSWLYVDDTGLHTRAIDREQESIAFMALSQVQVELILHCDSDLTTRTKRSIESDTANWLGPYDYGTKNWILTDTIPYNSRRSLVNLIVNDINDNAPIFVGKENEPIVVGYPVPELEDTVLPRSLAELEATDADIGENAALLYWSSEAELTVAPLTGFVHVRDGALLDHDMRFTVNATDRNGEGLTGSIVLQVKLLDVSNIIVVTVRDAFLDDETTVLANLSTAVGYDVKVLRSTVISDGVEDVTSRKKRETTNVPGTVLQLYVYGVIERELVAIEQLITDIKDNAEAIHIASTLSLEDHLEGQEICVIPGRDVGLLAATITLSILLFIMIVLIVLWFCRKRIWRKNYEEFSDENSLASRNESLSQSLKPESSTKPRLNIEELKRSERRLQEMLDAPVRDVVLEPPIEKIEVPLESKVDMTNIDPRAPIVIQSIDKLKDSVDESSSDDEFGEVRRAKKRKSVVTFNENVEKIIHVDDSDDINPQREYEVYKL